MEFEKDTVATMPQKGALSVQDVALLLTKAKQQIDQNEFEEAITFLNQVLTIQPDQSLAKFMLGDILTKVGATQDALPCFETAIQLAPKNIIYWHSYIRLIQTFDDPVASNEVIEIVRQQFDDELFFANEREALELLYRDGRYFDLDRLVSHLISKDLEDGLSWRFLGISLFEQRRYTESQYAMEIAVKLLPMDAVAHFNLASLLSKQNSLEESEKHFRRAITLNPQLVAAYNNLGNCLRKQGKLDEAESYLRMMIRFDKDFYIARVNLVGILKEKGELEKALVEAKKALKAAPNSSDVCNALGSILHTLGKNEEALVQLNRAIELSPNFADAYNNIGSVYFKEKKYRQAKPYFLKAIELNPQLGGAFRCLGQISQSLDLDFDSAEKYFRTALSIDRMDNEAHTSLLFMLSEKNNLSPRELFLEHASFGLVHENDSKYRILNHRNTRQKNRVLKIGFVSGDFNNHAVATFIEPVLKSFSKNTNFKLFAYYSNDVFDSVTTRLKEYFASWVDLAHKNDSQASEQIVKDGIDILFDLSGHTSKNRLTLFAKKPAPIQVTWMGYPGTTGLRSMDYFFADHYFLPNGKFDQLFTEKIGNLSSSAPFEPYELAPAISTLPFLKNRYFTFGSFNRLSKVGVDSIRLWSDVLNRVPTSKIVVAGMPPDANLKVYLDLFVSFGVACDRVSFVGRTSLQEYLGQYSQVDLCLDTFPYNGGTTTLHGIWMGVPTLSLVGGSIPARCAAAILGGSNLEGFLAESRDDFIAKAIEWTGNYEKLAELRSKSREKFLQSPKGNTDALVNSLEKALRFVWSRWCDGLGPVAFDVDLDTFKEHCLVLESNVTPV